MINHLSISEITIQEDRAGNFWGYYLDEPKPQSTTTGLSLHIAGWVLGRSGQPAAVVVVHQGTDLGKAPATDQRLDVAAVHPSRPSAGNCGFHLMVDVPSLPETSLAVVAQMVDGRRIPLARVKTTLLQSEQLPANGSERQAVERLIEEYALSPANRDSFAMLLTRILPEYTKWTWGAPGTYRTYFPIWQRAGFNLMPNHYYSSIPDVGQLTEAHLGKRSSMLGIDFEADEQVRLLEVFAASFKDEYGKWGTPASKLDPRFTFDNGAYDHVDAEVLYCLIRHFKPRRIVEIGSGFSTLVSAAACRMNKEEGAPCFFTAIEPYPNKLLNQPIEGLSELQRSKLEDIPLSLFEGLGENDILFIDSTHVIKCGNDVEYEYFEIIPRLAGGTFIHIHDIFLPMGYPPGWLREEHVFWNEQYILQAFLSFNTSFKTRWAGCYMHLNHPEKLAAAFPGYNPSRNLPGSFWMQRQK